MVESSAEMLRLQLGRSISWHESHVVLKYRPTNTYIFNGFEICKEVDYCLGLLVPLVHNRFCFRLKAKLIAPTWGTVNVLQVIQGSSSIHVPWANPLKYHLKVPYIPQGDLCSVPFIPLMASFVPDLPQVILRLWIGAALKQHNHMMAFQVTMSALISSSNGFSAAA